MKLSIIMPAYNEEKTLEEVITAVQNIKIPDFDKELIIVNDFSSDKTEKIIKRLKKKYNNILYFSHKKNMGKGAAIRTASKNVSGDFVIIQDSDLEYDPKDIVRLINFLRKNNLDVAYGSRILNKNNKHSYYSYFLGNLFLNKVTNFLYGSKITDMETCYKLIKADIFKNLNIKSNGFDMEPEITGKILRKGNKILEIPISYHPRSKNEGKKIKWRDGVIALWTLFYWRFKN